MKTCVALLLQSAVAWADGGRPEVLLADPAKLASPMDLKLLPSKTSSVYRARQGDWQFNLHSYIAHHDGKFWAIWSSGRVDEDSPSQLIRYATSLDGHTWSEARILVDDPDGPDKPGRWIARGVFVLDGRLTALVALLDGPRDTPQGRESWANLRLMRSVWDGSRWTDAGMFVNNCMNNYPPRLLGGRLFMTCRDSYAVMHTALADSRAGDRWKVTKLPGDPPHDRMSEPSWYVDPQGTTHLIFRDGRSSKYLYRSLSRDQGRTWSAPVRTNYPDATSKNIAGRLSNGWYFLINNPNQQGRDPLAISFSRDGWTFDNPVALRKNAPERRFEGRSKSNRSFQYPHVIERNGSLWVIYATNKEDIEISEFPIAAFGLPK
jgi:hypothetical protein